MPPAHDQHGGFAVFKTLGLRSFVKPVWAMEIAIEYGIGPLGFDRAFLVSMNALQGGVKCPS